MLDDNFNRLFSAFEAQTFTQFVSTKTDDNTLREQIFANLNGVRQLLTFMKDLVNEKAKLVAPELPDHSDDPNVHDIYSP